MLLSKTTFYLAVDAVLDIREVLGVRLFLVKNPWYVSR